MKEEQVPPGIIKFKNAKGDIYSLTDIHETINSAAYEEWVRINLGSKWCEASTIHEIEVNGVRWKQDENVVTPFGPEKIIGFDWLSEIGEWKVNTKHYHGTSNVFVTSLSKLPSSPDKESVELEAFHNKYSTTPELSKASYLAGWEARKQWQQSLPATPRGEGGWIEIKEGCKMPKSIEGKDYSENVFAILDGQIRIMAFCYIDYGDTPEECGWAWCIVYDGIDGDAEFDDNYSPTHWMKLPNPPINK